MGKESFANVPEKKRLAVITAGFNGFAKSGYDKASMSEIAEAAGISKALLFHYFGTKKNLYFYLFQFACGELAKGLIEGGEDFFECLLIGMRQKIDVMKAFPKMTEFLVALVLSNGTEFLGELRAEVWGISDKAMKMLFKNLDYSRFKEGISFSTALNLVSWISGGYIRSTGGKKPVIETMDEITAYLKLIKPVIYKEEYL